MLQLQLTHQRVFIDLLSHIIRVRIWTLPGMLTLLQDVDWYYIIENLLLIMLHQQ